MSDSAKRNPEIVFQNENFVVVDKPTQWLSVFSRMGKDETRPIVGVYLKELLNKEVLPCHRLDYEVSGLLMFALNPKAHAVSQKWFEAHTIRKNYLAQTAQLCDDNWPSNIQRKVLKDELQVGKSWTWKTMMSRGKRRAYEDAKGLRAVTEATFLGLQEQNLKWELSPITGRPHQLRLEMALRGFVIHGDELYSSKYPEQGISLQAYQLNLNQIPAGDRMGLPEVITLKEPLFHV